MHSMKSWAKVGHGKLRRGLIIEYQNEGRGNYQSVAQSGTHPTKVVKGEGERIGRSTGEKRKTGKSGDVSKKKGGLTNTVSAT